MGLRDPCANAVTVIGVGHPIAAADRVPDIGAAAHDLLALTDGIDHIALPGGVITELPIAAGNSTDPPAAPVTGALGGLHGTRATALTVVPVGHSITTADRVVDLGAFIGHLDALTWNVRSLAETRLAVTELSLGAAAAGDAAALAGEIADAVKLVVGRVKITAADAGSRNRIATGEEKGQGVDPVGDVDDAVIVNVITIGIVCWTPRPAEGRPCS